jgi:Xaa-Pro aminopeptidase
MKKQEIEKHRIAVRKLNLVKDRVFGYIKRNIGKISEYDVNGFILSDFRKQNLVTDKKNSIQIVAINQNAAIPHYFPNKKNSAIIKKNNLILVDIWARLNEKDSPFADITWMAYSGKNIPKDIKFIFNKVIKARNFTLKFIRKNLKKKKLVKTKVIDKAVRDYFKKFGLEKCFLHGLGHSLGIKECHGKYFRFGKKSQAKLKPNIPFTIEPGLYFKNKFGIRSEINCYITGDYKLIITTKIQNKIIKI